MNDDVDARNGLIAKEHENHDDVGINYAVNDDDDCAEDDDDNAGDDGERSETVGRVQAKKIQQQRAERLVLMLVIMASTMQ